MMYTIVSLVEYLLNLSTLNLEQLLCPQDTMQLVAKPTRLL